MVNKKDLIHLEYYWVKVSNDTNWEICLYYEGLDNAYFQGCGDYHIYMEGIYLIGDRIIKP